MRILRAWDDLWEFGCPKPGCRGCSVDNRIVPAQGPYPCRVMFIGEGPGENEDKRGVPFVGVTGYELDHTYLRLAGLDRQEVYVTNAFKRRPPNNRKPKPKEVECCAKWFLPTELDCVMPQYIVPMGATACSLFPEIDLEAMHGIPQWGRLMQWEGWVFPTNHPAAGLHDSTMMTPLLEDFERLRELLETDDPEALIPVDEFPERDYEEVGAEDLRAILRRGSGEYRRRGSGDLLALDQENQDGEVYSVQVSMRPGEGWLVRAGDREGLKVLGEYIAKVREGRVEATLLLHNAPQDLDWMEPLLKVEFPVWRLRDTMHEAYHQGNLPQGLKPLAYRLAGMKMQSYQEVVGEASREAVIDWMYEAAEIVPPPEREVPIIKRPKAVRETVEYRTKTGKLKTKTRMVKQEPVQVGVKRVVGRNEVFSAIKRILTHTSKPVEPGQTVYDPWKSWAKARVKMMTTGSKGTAEEKERRVERNLEDLERIRERVGEMPTAGLARVPRGKMLGYACADPDATLRVGLKLDGVRDRFQSIVSEGDYAV